MNYFTSESVTNGHPDKVADYISDSILDCILTQDKNARVAVETAVTTNTVFIMGEVSTTAEIDYEKVIRNAILEIGYDDDKYKFNGNTVEIIVKIDKQSNDIAIGVDKEDELGAGDQGIMFGYATDESESYLPLAIDLSHRITKELANVRVNNIIKGMRPDGKAQVTVCYDEIGKPLFVDKIIVSAQHDEDIDLEEFKKEIIEKVIKQVVPNKWLVKDTKYFINPTGRFVIGGPHGDSGLTGRKIIIDTYGSFARHGGGAFSGKDPSKVDRSASYMARYIAKNIVASGIARVCEIQLAYIIGISKPASFYINCFNTNKVSLEEIRKTVLTNFDLTPKGIIKTLDLLRPIYRETVNFGHFGRNNANFSWENTDKIDIFTKLL